VSNAASASIAGGLYGVAIHNSAGTVVNSGSIAGTTYDGVYLAVGGTVTNAASASISGGVDGIYASGGAGTVVNSGSIAGTGTGNSPNDIFVVYNSSDVVAPKAGSNDQVYAAASYTLPTGVDVLILEAGTQGVGNSDAGSDALYAANAGIAQTLTGNGANDVFVVYNASDVVVPKTGSHDTVYSAVNYTLPTGVDALFLEAGTQAAGNSDAAGDALYAANAAIAQTLTGNSHNDTFVVYNSADVLIGQAGSTDTVYAAENFVLPTNVDTLFLEGSSATHGTGNNDAVDTLFGNAGVASTLVAGSGVDTLYVTGTAGTILTGGVGHDTFAFPNVIGHDEVTNFGLTKDTLQFNATLFSNFTAAMNAASQSGANTVITIDTNDTVTLDNVTKTSLTASNFHFT
jgi:Ca2+-binding RTX toxin-like protein